MLVFRLPLSQPTATELSTPYRLFVAIFHCVLLLFLALDHANADSSSQGSLLTGAAAQKALDKSSQGAGRERIGTGVVRSSSSSSGGADDLRLESANDILFSSAKEAELRKHYGMLGYFSYVQDVVDVDGLDELEQSSFAQKLAVFQTLRTVGQMVKGTPIEGYYRQAAKSVAEFREYTTLKVVQGTNGSIGIKQGEREVVEDRKLFELKLHASPDSIGPQLKLSEKLNLSYDPLQQKAMLEFRHNF